MICEQPFHLFDALQIIRAQAYPFVATGLQLIVLYSVYGIVYILRSVLLPPTYMLYVRIHLYGEQDMYSVKALFYFCWVYLGKVNIVAISFF